jgi:hypothetical protein
VPYDSWAVTFGPWAGLTDPAFGQQPYMGLRLGIYRLQEVRGGVFLAYDPNDQDFRVGADAIWDHFPLPRTQIGAQYSRSLSPDWSNFQKDRAKVFGRYIFSYTPSLYMNPMEFIEVYGRMENEFTGRGPVRRAGIERYDNLAAWGVMYYRDFRTPIGTRMLVTVSTLTTRMVSPSWAATKPITGFSLRELYLAVSRWLRVPFADPSCVPFGRRCRLAEQWSAFSTWRFATAPRSRSLGSRRQRSVAGFDRVAISYLPRLATKYR